VVSAVWSAVQVSAVQVSVVRLWPEAFVPVVSVRWVA
jgi:hypothetical protein